MTKSMFISDVKAALESVGRWEPTGNDYMQGFARGRIDAYEIICKDITGEDGRYDIATNKFYIGGVEV